MLLGLEIAYTHQHFAALIRSEAAGERDECDRVPTGLQLFTLIARRFHEGKDPPTSDELSRRFLVATGSVDSHLDRLVRAGLVRRVSISAGGDGVVPSRSLDEIRVADVIAVFVSMGEVELRKRPIELAVEVVPIGPDQEVFGYRFLTELDQSIQKRPIELAVEEFVATFRNAGFEAIGDTSFLDVVRGLPAPTETP